MLNTSEAARVCHAWSRLPFDCPPELAVKVYLSLRSLGRSDRFESVIFLADGIPAIECFLEQISQVP